MADFYASLDVFFDPVIRAAESIELMEALAAGMDDEQAAVDDQLEPAELYDTMPPRMPQDVSGEQEPVIESAVVSEPPPVSPAHGEFTSDPDGVEKGTDEKHLGERCVDPRGSAAEEPEQDGAGGDAQHPQVPRTRSGARFRVVLGGLG